jgi:hypothetical protein
MNPEIADDIELLVAATGHIVHTPENQTYLDAAARVEAYLATYDPR